MMLALGSVSYSPGQIVYNMNNPELLPDGCKYEPYDPGGRQMTVLKYKVVCPDADVKDNLITMKLAGIPLPLLLVGGLLMASFLLGGSK